jgi:hypothetical protein
VVYSDGTFVLEGKGVPGSWIDVAFQVASTHLGTNGFGVGPIVASASVGSDGKFSASISAPSGNDVTLVLVQRPNGVTSCASTPATCSYQITWPLSLHPPKSDSDLVITSPRNPTNIPNPAANTIAVNGTGTPEQVTVTEVAGDVGSIQSQSLVTDADGNISGTIVLSPATDANPNVGWHKLLFSQAGDTSIASGVVHPVFVSVGIRPPTVTFPRSGAHIDCSAVPPVPPDTDQLTGRQIFRLTGNVPYLESALWSLRVFEETGRGALKAVPVPLCRIGGIITICPGDRVVNTVADPDGTYAFKDAVVLEPGKHVLVVFEAPDLPAGSSQDEIAAHFRAFAGVASTSTSQLVIDAPPPKFNIPAGIGPFVLANLDTPIQQLGLSVVPFGGDAFRFFLNDGDCPASPLCTDGVADLNFKVGTRLYTTRARPSGAWSVDVSLLRGWNQITFSQVMDSEVGGAWSESCPSEVQFGVPTSNTDDFYVELDPVIQQLSVDATSPSGAIATFGATAVLIRQSDGTAVRPVPVVCDHMSGTTFPIGTTTALCKALDAATGALAVGWVKVRVVGGLPAIHLPPSIVPPAGLTVEATDQTGARVSYDVTANDAFGTPLLVTCTPPSSTLFSLTLGGPGTNVVCQASDAAGQTAQVNFPVYVVDTTPPVLTLPGPITVNGGPGGAVVSYTATATDSVSGVITPTCVPPSGSTFPLGTTPVNCTASDAAGNAAVPGSFTVTVINPNTPPVVTVPANLKVEATGPSGAKVTFTATATDAQDGTLTPTCTLASGTTFAIGTTTVTCTANDSGGLSGAASFTVTVTDTKGPTFSNVPGTITAYATTASGAKVSYTKPNANDTVDGARPVTCTPTSGSQFPVYKTTVTCTASDTRGNTNTATFTVWVTYQAPTDGTFFLFPIRSNGSSIFRIGRPVPVRFKLTGASHNITNLVAKLTVTKISNAIQGTAFDTSDETVDDTDFIFKYRPILMFYAYRWKTRDQTQGTFQLKADLGDGVVHQVNVSLKP